MLAQPPSCWRLDTPNKMKGDNREKVAIATLLELGCEEAGAETPLDDPTVDEHLGEHGFDGR